MTHPKRIRQNHSTKTEPKQAHPPGQAGVLPANTPAVSQGCRAAADVDHEAWDQMRIAKLNSPVNVRPLGIYFSERSDAQLLDFVSLVVADHTPALLRFAAATVQDTGRIGIGDAVIAATAAARRALYHGLRAAPTADMEAAGQKRSPLLLDLPGFSGLMEYTDSTLLFHICSTIYHDHEEILRLIQPELVGEREMRFLEAMAIAELVTDRGSPLDVVEDCEKNGTLTLLQDLVARHRAARASRGAAPASRSSRN